MVEDLKESGGDKYIVPDKEKELLEGVGNCPEGWHFHIERAVLAHFLLSEGTI